MLAGEDTAAAAPNTDLSGALLLLRRCLLPSWLLPLLLLLLLLLRCLLV